MAPLLRSAPRMRVTTFVAFLWFAFLGCHSDDDSMAFDQGVGDVAAADSNIACPPSEPNSGLVGSCSEIGQACDYPTAHCTCYSDGGGSGPPGFWSCNPLSCPVTPPTTGMSCTPTAGGDCNYGFERECRCLSSDAVWVCCGGVPSRCEDARLGDLCCGVFVGCPGDGGSLTCSGNHWT